MPPYPTYKLGDVAEIILGQSPESKSYNTKGEGLPFFQGKTEFTDWFPIPNKWCTEPKKIAEPFDVLLSVRAPVGPTNIAKEKCCIGRGLAAIRYADCYKYVLYYLRSVSKYLESKATGTTFSSISGDTIKNLSIPLPSLPIQHQIVSRIESLFAELDKAEAHLRTAQQQLKTYKQAVLNHWLNNEDGKWETVKLGEVLDRIEAGKSFRCNEKVPALHEKGIVKISAVTWGEFKEDECKTITNEELYNPKYRICEGDLLMSRANTIQLVGNCVLVRNKPARNIMLSDKVLRLVPNGCIDPKYTLYSLRTTNCRLQIQTMSTGNQDSMRNIGQDRIKKIQIHLPPLPEQQRIVEEIETRLSQAEAAEARIAEVLQKTEALRQSILKKAFSGELV